MRKLIMQLELSLDGFYAGPNGKFDWFQLDREWWETRATQYFPTIDTVLLGRRKYEGFRQSWPNVARLPQVSETDLTFSRWLDAVPKVVFSTSLSGADWTNSRLANDHLVEVVSGLKQGAGGDILIMSSASLAQQCMSHGLIDEFWLTVQPVALGSGLPLFKEQVKLTLLESRVYRFGAIFQHYAVPRIPENKRR